MHSHSLSYTLSCDLCFVGVEDADKQKWLRIVHRFVLLGTMLLHHRSDAVCVLTMIKATRKQEKEREKRGTKCASLETR